MTCLPSDLSCLISSTSSGSSRRLARSPPESLGFFFMRSLALAKNSPSFFRLEPTQTTATSPSVKEDAGNTLEIPSKGVTMFLS